MRKLSNNITGLASAFALSLLALVFMASPSMADGLPTKSGVAAPSQLGLVPVPDFGGKSSWTGVWVGLYGAHAIGEVSSSGSPVGLSSDGQMVLPAVGFDVQAGQLVWGGEASYGWVFGNLNDLGIDNQLNLTARLGFLPTPDVLIYGHAGWSRVFTSGSDFDGVQFGPGVEVRFPGSAFSLDFRYAYGIWDVPGVPSSVDVNSHAFLIGGKYRFGGGK